MAELAECDCAVFQSSGSRYVLQESAVLGIHGVTLCGRCDHPEQNHGQRVGSPAAKLPTSSQRQGSDRG